MRSPHRKAISLLMLVIFSMGLGVYGFNSKRLAHELDHERQTLAASADHDRAPQLDPKANPDPEPLSDADHHLLYAASHFQPLLIGSTLDGFEEPPARTAPIMSNLLALLSAELESPFRPPRTASRI